MPYHSQNGKKYFYKTEAQLKKIQNRLEVVDILEGIVTGVVENNHEPCVMATPVIENPNHVDLIELEKPKKKKTIVKNKKKKPEQNEKKSTRPRRSQLEIIPSDILEWENMDYEQKFMESIFESTKPQLFSLRGGLEKLGQGYHKISHMDRNEHTQALLKCKKWRGDNHWKKIIPLVKKSVMDKMKKQDFKCYQVFQDLKENNYIWDDSFYDGGWIFE